MIKPPPPQENLDPTRIEPGSVVALEGHPPGVNDRLAPAQGDANLILAQLRRVLPEGGVWVVEQYPLGGSEAENPAP
jgi:hypothetical protein